MPGTENVRKAESAVRTKLVESNKPEKYIHSVKNMDTSAAGATIPTGSPLILNLLATPQPSVYTNGLPAGWEDGLQVVLPGSASNAMVGAFFYGVATGPIVFQQLGETMVHGVAQAAVLRSTRANTTSSWPSVASAPGYLLGLSVDTTANAFVTIASTATSPTPSAILVDDLKTLSGLASSPADTSTVRTSLARAWVKVM